MTIHALNPAQKPHHYAVGDTIASPFRAMTRERMRWYVDAQETAVQNDGKPHFGGPTIHDDDAYAVKQGLPGIIADGMVSTNWILSLLVDTFGPQFVRKGQLRTKYIAPVYENMKLRCCASVTGCEHRDGNIQYQLDVWCETSEGEKVTVGEAETWLPEQADAE